MKVVHITAIPAHARPDGQLEAYDPKIVALTEDGRIFDRYFNRQTMKWSPWRELDMPPGYEPDGCRHFYEMMRADISS